MLFNSLFKHWSYKLFTPGTVLREKYEALKQLLRYDTNCHERMAELQELPFVSEKEDYVRTRKRFSHFSRQVYSMVECLEKMAPGRYSTLMDYHKKFDFYTRYLLAPPKIDFSPPFVLPLEKLRESAKVTGNKGLHLSMIKNNLGLHVPGGFVVTASSFHYFIEYNNLRNRIDKQLASLIVSDLDSCKKTSEEIIRLIDSSELPPDIENATNAAVQQLLNSQGPELLFAVRSSGIHEDSNSSFAGQYTSLLNVAPDDILNAYKKVLASKYLPSALYYRINRGLGDEETAMSVLVQKMVNAQCSGVIYTSDISGSTEPDDKIYIHATEGLADSLVDGRARPEQFVVDKTPPHRLTELKFYKNSNKHESQTFSELAQLSLKIEKYFDCPQDIEWAMDNDGTIFVLQARQLHQVRSDKKNMPEIQIDLPVLVKDCEKASPGIAGGRIHILQKDKLTQDNPTGTVLVVKNSLPSYVTLLTSVCAVISEQGSRASHFATVAREFGVPFITGVADATNRFKQGSEVTVNGDSGIVYLGQLEGSTKMPSPINITSYSRNLTEALKFITPLELINPSAKNFSPEGCRSMHDIIRFCHEKALHTMFSDTRPGTGRGALRLIDDMALDVYLFDVGGGCNADSIQKAGIPLIGITSAPFHALWQGMNHPDVQWKQKPFDWEAYDKALLSGGVPPKRDSFAFASYAVIGKDYLHFNIRFGYHFSIIDALCEDNSTTNHCMLRFAGGGGDFHRRSLRVDFITRVLQRLDFIVEPKGDLLEARLPSTDKDLMLERLDLLGRLLGSTKLLDMVLQDEEMVSSFVEDFFAGRYSFSEQG